MHKWILIWLLFPAIASAQVGLKSPVLLGLLGKRSPGGSGTNACDGVPSIVAEGDEYLFRATDLGNASHIDTNRFMFSMWLKRQSSGIDEVLIDNNHGLRINIQANDIIHLQGLTNGGGNVILMDSAVPILNDDLWHHLFVAVNLEVDQASYIFLDGSDVTERPISTYVTAGLLDTFGVTEWSILSKPDGSSTFHGLVAEIYYNEDFLDPTVNGNIEKFWNPVGGIPASLGADGSLPTGTQPALYFHTAAPNFEVNSGNSGSFTEISSLSSGGSDTPCAGQTGGNNSFLSENNSPFRLENGWRIAIGWE